MSGYTAFYLGVKSVCDSAKMKVRYTNSWYDEDGEKSAAEKLIDEDKCKIISQHADSQGAPSVCESKNVPNVFFNGENKEKANSYLISSRINWKPYFRYFIENTQAGTTMDYDWIGTLSDGSVEIFDASDIAASGTQDAVNQAINDLKAGSLHVFDTSKFTVNGNPVTTYKVDGKEAISDGYFHESEFTSAPYFDLRIDGINEITDDATTTTPAKTTPTTSAPTTNPNSTIPINHYRKSSSGGLSAGGICAIVIPTSIILLAVLFLTLKSGSVPVGAPANVNPPNPNLNMNDSHHLFNLRTETHKKVINV